MDDMATDRDWQRLADCVRERRTDLDLTQEDVRGEGGPSTATLRLIEGALQDNYQPIILRRLEDALKWERGSVRRVLDGGDPTPLPAAPAAVALVPAAPEPAPDSGDDVAGAVLAALIGPKERRIWAQVRRHLEASPAGRMLFADENEAAAWPPESPDGFSGGAPFGLTAEARRLLDATPAAELFRDPNEVTVWNLDRVPYRKRVEMLVMYREPVRHSNARRAGLKKPDALSA